MRVVAATREQVRPLQQQVLRPNGPLPGDREPPENWCHLAILRGGEVVAAASAGPVPPPAVLSDLAAPWWQLRSMAVAPDHRNHGLGSALLRAVVERAWDGGVASLWAEARLPAVSLYVRNGWSVAAEEWEKPGVGPHRYVWIAARP